MRKDIQNKYLYRLRIHQYFPQSGKFEEVEVTDPYSKSTAYHSSFSRFIDLESIGPHVIDSKDTKGLAVRADHIIYETHVRDFSIKDQGINKAHRENGQPSTKKIL